MMVITRFRAHEPAFRNQLEAALDIFAQRPGYRHGFVGRNLDEPDLWVMVTQWADVGSYRRALSSYDIKVGTGEVMNHALYEPSAYESLDTELNRFDSRGSESLH